MNQKTLSNINKYLLLFIAALFAGVIFLVDYFGYVHPALTYLIIVLSISNGLYFVGKTTKINIVRRGANSLLSIAITAFSIYIAFILLQTTPTGIEWVFSLLFLLTLFGFSGWSIWNTIACWPNPALSKPS